MATYANQQNVIIYKVENSEKFAQIDMNVLQRAMQDLDGNALKLWLYFVRNKGKYQFAISPKAMEDWGLKKDAYYRSKKVLEEKGYLVEGENGLEFRDVPQVKYVF